MAGYTKLFNSIVTSTIWLEADHVRIVWITMLALSNKHGIVEGSAPGLARLSGVSLDRCLEAIRVLSSPDEHSRSRTLDGRRIVEVEGGWQLVNHAHYRALMSGDDKREYFRQKKAEQRERQRSHTEEIKSEAALPDFGLAGIWNAHCGTLPKCRAMSATRQRKAAARLREFGVERWTEIVQRIAASTFCNGTNDRGWVATFDWILQPDVAAKVLDGKYDNRAPVVTAQRRLSKAEASIAAGQRLLDRMGVPE